MLCSIQTPGKTRGRPRATSISAGSSAILKKVLLFMGPGMPTPRLYYTLTETAHAAVDTRLFLSQVQTAPRSCGRPALGN